jgi:outer membrane protein assembly factor BamB
MSKFNKIMFLALAAILVASLSAPAIAGPVYGEEGGQRDQLRQQYRDEMRALNPPSDILGLPATEGARLSPVAPPVGHVNTASPCQTVSNQCPGFEEAFLWNVPSSAAGVPGAGTRRAIATQVLNSGLKPESLVAVDVLVLWDPADELGIGFFPTSGQPDLRVEIYDDAAGLPGPTTLATLTIPFATWIADPGLGTFGGSTLVGYINFDLASQGVVIPIGGKVHSAVWVDQPLADNGWVWLWGDDSDVGGCADLSSNYRSSIPGWISTNANYGFVTNWSIYTTLCTEQPPPVCFTQHNWCDAAASVSIFGMPRTTRNAFANRYFAGQAGQAQPCTVKTIYPWFYENNPADSADVVVMIMEDDGGGLPGAVVWSDSLPYSTLLKDLSGPTVVSVPDVVVTGEYYIGYRAVNPLGGTINCITFVGSLLGGGDPACPAYDPNAMFVQLPSLAWTDENTFFGSAVGSELWVDADICCPALEFLACTPASETNWEAQGNGNGRTNASTASMSSLCGINQAWSHDFAGTVLQLQPVVAGGKVLVARTDTLFALDQATGATMWAIGGFPYIVGNLRGAPTVDVAAGRVYFGGSGAQAFTCVDLATGAVVWSRNLGGGDPPFTPLNPGQTSWTPSVLAGGVIYFTQETGWLYGLNAATGVDVPGSPLAIPGAPAAIPLNALTGNGSKLWVGTANSLGTAGRLIQVNAATLTIDWSLINPGMIFYPGNTDFYDPEGFPGSLAYENGVLYYHSQIRNDGNGFAHFPQTGAVGAIDVALENGTGAGILWINDADVVTAASPGTALGTTGYSGPALGPQMLYLNSRGFFGGTTEQDGVAAFDRTLGARVWYQGYTNLGVSGGVPVLDDVRGESPISVFCQADGVPYLFVGNFGGVWRLMNGNNGAILWERHFTSRVLGTALADNYVVMLVRSGSAAGGGSAVAFNVGADRPRLQLDTQYVYRTATPGDGLTADVITDALRNTGCVNLNISAYSAVNPPVVRVSSVHPSLTSSAKRSTSKLSGYDALLNPPTAKQLKIDVLGGVEEGEEESLVRTFANNARGAADPLFLAVTQAPGAVAPGATQSIAVTYDETGLTNNTGYTNYIEITSDDPDYFPQDPSGAVLGLPTITFQLFIGCPDAEAVMNTGLGEVWVNNFGADAGGGNFNDPGAQNFNILGNTANMFDGGLALVVQDSLHWAFDGCSVGGYPRRAGEWGPTLPCGVTINALNVPGPAGPDAIEEVSWNMLDLASTNGYFPASSRCAGGVFVTTQRVASQSADFGDFVLTKINIQNEPGDFGDISGSLNNMYYGGVTDWDVSGTDNLKAFPDGYGQTNGGSIGWGNPAATWIVGHARLDANIVGAGAIGMGGSPTFMGGDIFNDQGHGDAAFRMFSSPATYGASVDPASTNNTDIGALWSFLHVPSLADGASATMYYCIFQAEAGVNAIDWTNAAEADAVYKEITCRAKAFAGFGKGDVNCDGCIDLADVVLLGNILDGLYNPAGTGGVYTADANGDNAYTQADYDLVYDVVAGVQPASAMANAWRF